MSCGFILIVFLECDEKKSNNRTKIKFNGSHLSIYKVLLKPKNIAFRPSHIYCIVYIIQCSPVIQFSVCKRQWIMQVLTANHGYCESLNWFCSNIQAAYPCIPQTPTAPAFVVHITKFVLSNCVQMVQRKPLKLSYLQLRKGFNNFSNTL